MSSPPAKLKPVPPKVGGGGAADGGGGARGSSMQPRAAAELGVPPPKLPKPAGALPPESVAVTAELREVIRALVPREEAVP